MLLHTAFLLSVKIYVCHYFNRLLEVTMDSEFQSYFYAVPTFRSCPTDFVLCLDSVMGSIGRTSGGKRLVSPLLFPDVSYYLVVAHTQQ